MKQIFSAISLWLLTTSLVVASAAEQEWGTLSGRFVLKGPIPEPMELLVDKEKVVCGPKQFDETLVVNPKDRGIANIFVWLVSPGSDKLPIHRDRAKEKEKEVIWTIDRCRFVPHVLAVQTKPQTLIVEAKDPVGHNPKFHLFKDYLSQTIATTATTSRNFPEPTSEPIFASCSIHPWMTGVLLVQDHPYFAITDASGKFTIPKIPIGKWTFRFWHEGKGFITAVERGGKVEKWPKGCKELNINFADTDLGELSLTAKDLLKLDADAK